MPPRASRVAAAYEAAVPGQVLYAELRLAEDELTLSRHKTEALENLLDALQTEVEGLTRKWQLERRARLALERIVTSRGGGATDSRWGSFSFGIHLPFLLEQVRGSASDAPARVAEAAAGGPRSERDDGSSERRVGLANGASPSSTPALTREGSGPSVFEQLMPQRRTPGLAPPKVLYYGQPSELVMRPAKPELALALGGPKVAPDYREWAEPLHGAALSSAPALLCPCGRGSARRRLCPGKAREGGG